MGFMTNVKNLSRGESGLRIGVGAVLIVVAFLVSGISGWTLGLIGIALILTGLFGY